MGEVHRLQMTIIVRDIESDRVNRPADNSKILLSYPEARIITQNQGIAIKKIEMKQYIERLDERLGKYSLITIIIETDRGTLEMKYDEGFRGEDALDTAVTMLTKYLGLAALINRVQIEVERSFNNHSIK